MIVAALHKPTAAANEPPPGGAPPKEPPAAAGLGFWVSGLGFRV